VRLKPVRRLLLFGVLGLFAAAALMTASTFYTWHRLTLEKPVARLTFDAVSPQVYRVSFYLPGQCEPLVREIKGDQWRVDAAFLKWKSWANLLGFDARYRLERLGGRYRSAEQETTQPRTAIDLEPAGLPDLAALAARYIGRLSPVDTQFGSSVYLDIDPALEYRVYHGQSGLIARSGPRPAPVYRNGVLVIPIEDSCSGGASAP